MTATPDGILVGYDGSAASEHALGWAAREARSRGLALTVCQAWAPGLPEPAAPVLDSARRSGELVLAAGMRSARALMGPGEVRPLLAGRTAVAALTDHSRSADMVVLGCRGRGGMSGLLLGSVSAQVAALACGRVVVVRGHWRPAGGYNPGPVVVGADGSAASDAAVAFAFEEAALREAPLLAVCALSDMPGCLGEAHGLREKFDRALDRWEKELPEVVVRRHVAVGAARGALLAAAGGAQLLAVGSRGRGGLRGMMLGSVSQAVLAHAACPVAVVHPAARPG